jgi:hypothetical protein
MVAYWGGNVNARTRRITSQIAAKRIIREILPNASNYDRIRMVEEAATPHHTAFPQTPCHNDPKQKHVAHQLFRCLFMAIDCP